MLILGFVFFLLNSILLALIAKRILGNQVDNRANEHSFADTKERNFFCVIFFLLVKGLLWFNLWAFTHKKIQTNSVEFILGVLLASTVILYACLKSNKLLFKKRSVIPLKKR